MKNNLKIYRLNSPLSVVSYIIQFNIRSKSGGSLLSLDKNPLSAPVQGKSPFSVISPPLPIRIKAMNVASLGYFQPHDEP